ncbi:MAG: hypothetical protein ACE5IA_04120 [Dehalococcoidia bacterium]
MTSFPSRGVFLLSIDTELAWGSVHNGGYRHYEAQYQECREVVVRLLELMERYEIEATWAVVGHLFLSQCQAIGGIKHPEIVRPSYTRHKGDWFAPDPCADLESAPLWYGVDIVRRILNCRVPQEIGCHTFSHIVVGDTGCSTRCFESELAACAQAADTLGLKLTTFVFPRNAVGHLGALGRSGFIAYRGPARSRLSRLPVPAQKIGHALSDLFLLPPPVSLPELQGEVWNLPASYFYPPHTGWGRFVPIAFRVRKAQKGLERAVRERRLFHMWFHPFNLATDPEGLLGGLEGIFAQVRRYREAGVLDNLTMVELSRSLNWGQQQ